jgi:aerobic-type carbon monoxide dehydrogenase small subunit (CoxS/CutS family)
VAELGTVRLTVNGVALEGRCESRKLLVDFLREDLGLTGTHVGCEHGICGACTILFNGEAARSCIMLAVQADGAELVTIEGLAREIEKLGGRSAAPRRAGPTRAARAAYRVKEAEATAAR